VTADRVAIAGAAGQAPALCRPSDGVWNGTAWAAAPRGAPPHPVVHVGVGLARDGAHPADRVAQPRRRTAGRTLAALPKILAGLEAGGLRPVTLSGLVRPDPPTA